MADIGIIVALVLIVLGAVSCFCWMLFGDPAWARMSPPSSPSSPAFRAAHPTPRTPPIGNVTPVAAAESHTAPVAYRVDHVDHSGDVPVVVVVVDSAESR